MAVPPRLQRVRDFVLATVERPLLFAFWAVVLWGTLLIALFGVRVASAGLAEATETLWPTPEAGFYAYGNVTAVALAVVVWLALAVMALVGRRVRS